MSTPGLDAEIANLYQLPLAEFTSARNALAKQAGSRAADPCAAEATGRGMGDQSAVLARQRDVYDRSSARAGDLRAAHAAVLAGKAGDVRSAGKSHEEAIEAALKATLGILREAGQPATDATRQAIGNDPAGAPGARPRVS